MKKLTIEEFLEGLETKAIPLQKQKILLLEKLYELTGNEKTDSNTADMELKERHIKVIENKIKEVEIKMGIN